MKLTLLAFVTLAAAGWAQTTPPAPPVTELKAYLSLTDSQVQSLQTIRTTLHNSILSLQQQIASKEQTLRSQLTAGGTSAAVLGQELLDIQNLRTQVTQARTAAQTQAVAVLTADQKTKLQALDAASKLQRQIQEADALGLLVPPTPTGLGPGGRGMGAGMGMGMGPGMGVGPMGMGRGMGGRLRQ